MAMTNPILISQPPQHGSGPVLPGHPLYAYQAAAERFLAMFEALGVAVKVIESPEQFKSAAFAELHGLGTGEHLHLMFRGIEEMRPIPGAYNVAWFSWSFDALKSDGPSDELVLRDQVRMLRACNEVWVPSQHTKAVLQRYGIDRVFVLPAPVRPVTAGLRQGKTALRALAEREAAPLVTTIADDHAAFGALAERFAGPLGTRPRFGPALADGRVFLTVCNPLDARKNLTTLIEGFLMGTAGGSGKDLLLVNLANSGAMAEPAEYLFHQVRPLFGDPHALHEEGVLFLSGPFSDAEMAQLYAGADFYLSAALGAGQNLSLLEAMAQGCVPVSVRNTAMADYIDEDDAVVIGEGRYSGLLPRISPELSHLRTDNSFADRFRIAEAVRQALSLDDPTRAAKVRSARERIASRYTPERVFAAMSARLSETRPDLIPVPRPAPPPQPQVQEARERKGWLRALLG